MIDDSIRILRENQLLNDLPLIDVSEMEFYEYKQKVQLPTVETSK